MSSLHHVVVVFASLVVPANAGSEHAPSSAAAHAGSHAPSPFEVVAPVAVGEDPPLPEHGTWAWLQDLSGPATLVVDAESWQRLLGAAARDPATRPVFAEVLDRYRRRMVDAFDRFESTVAPGVEPAARRAWYRHHGSEDPRLAHSSAGAHRALRRDELAALDALAVETVDAALELAHGDDRSTTFVLRDGGAGPALVPMPTDPQQREQLVVLVRDELIITARLGHLRPLSISGIAGVGEKLDVLLEIDGFLDRHAELARAAAPPASRDDAFAMVALDALRPHLSPHRADLARLHLAWRDAFANVRRSTHDDGVDRAREWRTIRRSMLDIGLINDALAQQAAGALRLLCADGETAARTWLREWRVRASDESVPISDSFETAIAWVEATDAVATEAGRAALREMRREHELRRIAHDEAIMRARFDRLRCTSRTDDPDECPRDGIVAAETALEESARRRLGDLRGLITSPELADLFERRIAAPRNAVPRRGVRSE